MNLRREDLNPLKRKRQVELHTCFYTLDDGHSGRLYTTKTKAVPRSADEKFTYIQNLDENSGRRAHLSRIQTKQWMTDKQNRRHRVKRKHQRLNPRQDTLSQRAGKRQKRQCLNRGTTETRERDWQAEWRKTPSSVENTVGNLPIKVNDLAIKIEEGQRLPSSWPVKSTKRRGKLLNTVRVSKPFGK